MTVNWKLTLLLMVAFGLLSLVNGESCGTKVQPDGSYRVNKIFTKYVYNSSYMPSSGSTESSARLILSQMAAIGKPFKQTYPTIEGAVCANYENFSGAVTGQFQCPIDGFKPTDVSCCGGQGFEYCCASCSPPNGDVTATALAITICVVTVVIVIAFIFGMRSKKKKENKESIEALKAKLKKYEEKNKKEMVKKAKKAQKPMNPFMTKAEVKDKKKKKSKKNKKDIKKAKKDTVIPIQQHNGATREQDLRHQSIPETEEQSEHTVPDEVKEARVTNAMLAELIGMMPESSFI